MMAPQSPPDYAGSNTFSDYGRFYPNGGADAPDGPIHREDTNNKGYYYRVYDGYNERAFHRGGIIQYNMMKRGRTGALVRVMVGGARRLGYRAGMRCGGGGRSGYD